MSRLTRIGAIVMTVVMVLAVATPAVTATSPPEITVDQGDSTYTVTVTHNGTPANDSVVNVTDNEPNATYSANGVTDENGTVTFDLPANETNVTIEATVNQSTATLNTTLNAASEADEPVWDQESPFGIWVTSWLHDLVSSGNNTALGQIVSDLVTENNPGSDHRSDKANPGGNTSGPPEHVTNTSANNASNGSGPPDHAGNASEDNGANSTDNGENASANGNSQGNTSDNGGNASDNGNDGGNGADNGNSGNASDNGNGNSSDESNGKSSLGRANEA